MRKESKEQPTGQKAPGYHRFRASTGVKRNGAFACPKSDARHFCTKPLQQGERRSMDKMEESRVRGTEGVRLQQIRGKLRNRFVPVLSLTAAGLCAVFEMLEEKGERVFGRKSSKNLDDQN